MAPEILVANSSSPAKITEKCDVYSFSIVIWEILTRKKAFSNHNNFSQFRNCVLRGERPPLQSNCIPSLCLLLNRCWAASPRERPTFDEIAVELANIIEEYRVHEQRHEVGTDIADPTGNYFWYRYFPVQAAVHWDIFCDAFCEALNTNASPEHYLTIDSIQLRCLRELLLDKEGNVTRKMFGKILGWFGCLQFPYNNNQNHFLNRIVYTLRLPYFFGSLSSGDATSMLNNQPPGTFLIRFSGNHPNSLCISRVETSGSPAKHTVVLCQGGNYILQDYSTPNIDKLAQLAAERFSLKKYCTCEKYVSLFTPTAIKESNSEASVKDCSYIIQDDKDTDYDMDFY